MFLNLEPQTARLDIGIAGVSPIEMGLIFAMMFLVSMIPYFLLYLSLRPNRTAAGGAPAFFSKLAASMHPHRHQELLHH